MFSRQNTMVEKVFWVEKVFPSHWKLIHRFNFCEVLYTILNSLGEDNILFFSCTWEHQAPASHRWEEIKCCSKLKTKKKQTKNQAAWSELFQTFDLNVSNQPGNDSSAHTSFLLYPASWDLPWVIIPLMQISHIKLYQRMPIPGNDFIVRSPRNLQLLCTLYTF